MKRSISSMTRFVFLTAALVFVVGIGYAGQTSAAEFPSAICIATSASGSAAYAVSVGMASVISKNTPMQATAQPYPATGMYVQKLRNGQCELAQQSAINVWSPYHGSLAFKKLGKTNLRLIKRGQGSFLLSILIRKDLNLRRLSDLKGKKYKLAMPKGHVSANVLLNSLLIGAGLTRKDIKILDVASLGAGARMMKEGRTDLAFIRLGAGILEDLNSVVPVKYLDATPASDENMKKMLEYCGIARMVPVKGGSSPYIPEDMMVISQDTYVLGIDTLKGPIAYAVAKTLYEKYDDLAMIHRELKKSYKPGLSVPDFFDIPYHPGAIKYYKEVGLWTGKHDEVQRKAIENQ